LVLCQLPLSNDFFYFQTQVLKNSWEIKLSSINEKGEILFTRDLSLITEELKDFKPDRPKKKRRRFRRSRR
jgi:hypothetical protein